MNPRPLLRAQRRTLQRERTLREADQSRAEIAAAQARLDHANRDLDLSFRQADKTDETVRSLMEVLIRQAEQAQREASAIAVWLLSSALAANLAGIWAMIPQKSMDHRSLQWSIIWFVSGAISSLLAGLYRASIAGHDSAAIINFTIAATGYRRAKREGDSGVEPKLAPLQMAGFRSSLVALFSSLAVAAFIAGAIVAITALI
jgi:hypothetical protein